MNFTPHTSSLSKIWIFFNGMVVKGLISLLGIKHQFIEHSITRTYCIKISCNIRILYRVKIEAAALGIVWRENLFSRWIWSNILFDATAYTLYRKTSMALYSFIVQNNSFNINWKFLSKLFWGNISWYW